MVGKLYILYPTLYYLSKLNGGKKLSKQETETVKYDLTVTVEIPEKVNKLLERYATFVGCSVEDILKTHIYPDVQDFWHNQVFQDLLIATIEDAGCADFFQIRQGETE
jgi:hypothetical protein